ncbi:cytochrome b [filamentous cyanobacterium LEGE 11480]|uniref:Cytochrome b n=1 Tax=Romeriopsis navalis LEGE 11480 TaxID=2777977 RepID=A0A928VIV7_9CYAN|nr:cytochrome b/b6 domain-containing protein [Romeriopsis navalis]MBE9029428.1 cytochrome b [Romeriopsis navalis LEGE 11480]
MTSPNQTRASKPPRRSNSAFLHLMSIHWWMARLYVLLLAGGWGMVHVPLPQDGRDFAYDLHKSLGILTLIFLAWRVVILIQVWWRKYTKRPPQVTPAWLHKVMLHTLLYLFMGCVPITGVWLSNAYKAHNVKFFGIAIPDLFPQNTDTVEIARNLHFWLAYSFFALTILHLIAQWKVVRAHWRQVQKFIQIRLLSR